jgi:hypothetical protein
LSHDAENGMVNNMSIKTTKSGSIESRLKNAISRFDAASVKSILTENGQLLREEKAKPKTRAGVLQLMNAFLKHKARGN